MSPNLTEFKLMFFVLFFFTTGTRGMSAAIEKNIRISHLQVQITKCMESDSKQNQYVPKIKLQ